MSDRVLSTATARQAIIEVQRILNGPLLDQITALSRQGQTLSEPDVWDGRLAQDFRSTWPETHSSLTRAREALEELRANAEKINQNIMTAGGNV